ncbi:spore protease YyaC [Paenibacillus sp. MBLB4367]|uniref:spore protease YyaC n=1 Tax=Paenibacillus sp. MBLB4367 TaxID=3384767 RepID=UPI003908182B
MELSLDPQLFQMPPEPLKLHHTEQYTSQLLSKQLSAYFELVPSCQPIVFVCIGTDRSTGDALGPLVGSRLKKYNFSDIQLFGTLDEPVHAMNLKETLASIQEQYTLPYLVGIDACLGQLSSVGCIQLASGPLKPGAGVNKELPPVGDIHMTGIVNVGGFMEYFVLQNTRLSLVMNMAEVIAKSIYISLLSTKRIASFSTNASVTRLGQ